MSLVTYGVAGFFALSGSAVAVLFEQRLQRRSLAPCVIALALACAVLSSFYLLTGRIPALPDTASLETTEPWEQMIVPLVVAGLCCSVLITSPRLSPAPQLLGQMALASGAVLASLPAGDSYADVVPGNACWAVAVVLAVGANTLAWRYLRASGADRWGLWVIVAFSATVTALLLSCYATLGEWSLAITLSVGCIAAVRSSVRVELSPWTSPAAFIATVVGCGLLAQVRIYSSQAFPLWLTSLVLLLPVAVCLVDAQFGRSRTPRVRVILAAAVAAILACIVIAVVFSPADASEAW